MLSLIALTLSERPKMETVKQELRRLYKDHKEYSYRESHYLMYNDADCVDDQLYLIYSGEPYNWKCHTEDLPSQTTINAEHVVPRSFFRSQLPMLSDLHNLFSASAKINNARGNLPFAEFNYSQCREFCHGLQCQKTMPTNPEDWDCINKNKKSYMPREQDRGMVSRAVLYFLTMYDDVKVEQVGNLKTFKQWNRAFPPTEFEIQRNNKLNISQGNRNPYIDDYTLVDKAFP